MEKYRFHLQSESQDYTISTLNMQLDALTPIKASYANLQHYHVKISHDLQSMLQQHKEISSISSSKLKQQVMFLDELQQQKNMLIEKIRKIENQEAKLTLEKKNNGNLYEGLFSKIELEKQQQYNLIRRKKQLEDALIKVKINIQTANKFNEDILKEINDKSIQADRLQSEIKNRQQANNKLNINRQILQKDLRKISQQNDSLANKNRNLDNEILTIQNKCEEANKDNREQYQKIIAKNQQLSNVLNEKQYFFKILHNQENAYTALRSDQNQLENLIKSTNNELNIVNDQNTQLSNQITKQSEKIAQNRRYRDAVLSHMKNLIQMNNLIVDKMEEWCNEDRGVIKIIESKVNILSSVIQKNRGVMVSKDLNISPNLNNRKVQSIQNWTTSSSFPRKQC